MVNLKISPLTVEQLIKFTQTARPLDLKEWELGLAYPFSKCEITALEGTDCMCDTDTGEVYAIGGVDGDTVWVLCTSAVERHPIPFLRFCKTYGKQVWLPSTKVLYNYVWNGNPLHVKWLKWMGATFKETITFNNETFTCFTIRGDNNV